MTIDTFYQDRLSKAPRATWKQDLAKYIAAMGSKITEVALTERQVRSLLKCRHPDSLPDPLPRWLGKSIRIVVDEDRSQTWSEHEAA